MKEIKINPCKYRVSDGEDENNNPCDLCLKDVANGDGDPEPCDYCNTDFIDVEATNKGFKEIKRGVK